MTVPKLRLDNTLMKLKVTKGDFRFKNAGKKVKNSIFILSSNFKRDV